MSRKDELANLAKKLGRRIRLQPAEKPAEEPERPAGPPRR